MQVIESMELVSPYPTHFSTVFAPHDCTVVVGEAKFNVHQSVLMRCSPVFNAMLKSDMVEGRSNEIVIEDCETEAFEMLLLVFYETLSVDAMMRFGDKIITLANKYQAKPITDACIKYFTMTLTVDNIVQRLNVAEMVDSDLLLQEAVGFIIAHSSEIPRFSSIASSVSTSTMQLLLSEYATRYTKARNANALLKSQNRCVKNEVQKSPVKSSQYWQIK